MPAAIAALAAPFGGVRFVPTGGVGPSNLAEYLALPAVARRRRLVDGARATSSGAGDFAGIRR